MKRNKTISCDGNEIILILKSDYRAWKWKLQLKGRKLTNLWWNPTTKTTHLWLMKGGIYSWSMSLLGVDDASRILLLFPWSYPCIPASFLSMNLVPWNACLIWWSCVCHLIGPRVIPDVPDTQSASRTCNYWVIITQSG